MQFFAVLRSLLDDRVIKVPDMQNGQIDKPLGDSPREVFRPNGYGVYFPDFSARFRVIATLALVGLGVFPFGCAQTGSSSSEPDRLSRDGKELFGKGGAGVSGAGAGWTVVLAAFRGETAAQDAAAALEQIRSLSGFGDAFVEIRGQNHVVGWGRYDSVADQTAKDALQRARSFADSNGRRPFAAAILLAPDFSQVGSSGGKPEWNLTRAREIFGREAKYTLQIGTYGGAQPGQAVGAELAEARAAAEAAVAQLRAQGELAFYYHSPRMSTVTVGLFDDAALDNPLHPDLVAMRRKYPNRLHNGKGLITRIDKSKEQLEDSKLVAVPDR